jgi:hypothetical protein
VDTFSEGSLDKKEMKIIFILEIWKKGVIYYGTRLTNLETFQGVDALQTI